MENKFICIPIDDYKNNLSLSNPNKSLQQEVEEYLFYMHLYSRKFHFSSCDQNPFKHMWE